MADEDKIQLYKPGVLSKIRKLSTMIGASGPQEPETEIDLRYVLRVLREHSRTIVTAGLTLMLLALVVSLFMKPVYESHATIEIKEAAPEIESLRQLESRNGTSGDATATQIATEMGILRSQTLARQVIAQVHLGERQHSSFSLMGLVMSGWRAVVKLFPAGGSTPQGKTTSRDEIAEKKDEGLVGAFESKFDVSRVGSSRLVDISYQSDDPRFSALVVNTVISTYLQLHERSTERLTQALDQQVQEAKEELERSEKAMTGYARRNGLVYLESGSGTSQNIVDQRLLQIQDQLTQAQANRYQVESVYRLIRKGDYGSLPGVFKDSLLQNLTVKVADLKRQYAELSATFTDQYPKVKQVKSQLTAMEKELAHERARAAANITNDYLAAVRREALLVEAYQQQKNAASDVHEKSNQYNILKKNTETDNQVYQSLLQKVKEAVLIAQIKANNVNVVDKAVPKYFPIKPKILFNMVLGLIAGLGLGVGLAFLHDHLDTTLKTAEEIDRFLGVPALAMIPAMDMLPKHATNGNNHNGNGLMLPDVFDQTALTKAEQPWYRIDKQRQDGYSPLIEAFRTLGSSVMLEGASRKKVLRSIVITSSQPGEGKTTVSVNLAIALAQQGRRVLLIDADMRRPAVHRALGFRNIRGLAGYLRGMSEWPPCVLPGLTPGLDTLPAGKTPQNPVALLTSSRMKLLLEQTLEEYEYVIVDCPALMPNLVDARILAELVDGSMLVVRLGLAPREFVLRARKHLNNIFGVVLNSMDVRSPDYYYYYGYGPYGYGPEKDDKATDDNSFEKRIAG